MAGLSRHGDVATPATSTLEELLSVTTTTREFDDQGRVVKETVITQGDTSGGCFCVPPTVWNSTIPWTCPHHYRPSGTTWTSQGTTTTPPDIYC